MPREKLRKFWKRVAREHWRALCSTRGTPMKGAFGDTGWHWGHVWSIRRYGNQRKPAPTWRRL